MTLYNIQTGLLGVNTYFLVNDQTKQCIVIDSGEKYDKIMEYAKDLGVTIKALLLTHSHYDHSHNAKRIQLDGVKVYASQKESRKLESGQTLCEHFRKSPEPFSPDYEFVDGEVLNICDIEIKVKLTPGHTDGSAIFIVEDMIFSGDTLFFESVGRTDFPTGNTSDLISSIKYIYNNFDGYKVYPGHGEFTTVEHEKKFNPYVRND